jgi:hypothetical protein
MSSVGIPGMRNPFKGFFAKRNRRATRRSVVLSALAGAVAVPAVGYLLGAGEFHIGSEHVMAGFKFWMYLSAVGAICFAATNWQGTC